MSICFGLKKKPTVIVLVFDEPIHGCLQYILYNFWAPLTGVPENYLPKLCIGVTDFLFRHFNILATQSSFRSLVVGWSVGWLVGRSVIKTYLPSYLCYSKDMSDSSDSCDRSDICDNSDSSDSSNKNNIFLKKLYSPNIFSHKKILFVYYKKILLFSQKKNFFFLTKYQNTVFTTKDFFSPKKKHENRNCDAT